MNNEECNEVYDILINTLNQQKLEWVVAQVAEQVRLGKTVEKKIETLKENHGKPIEPPYYSSEIPLKKEPKATFSVVEDYSPKERLILLVDAIEQAVVNTSEMECHIIGFLENEQKNLDEIKFYIGEEGEEFSKINKRTATTRHQNSNRLKELLVKLRKEAKNNDNK